MRSEARLVFLCGPQVLWAPGDRAERPGGGVRFPPGPPFDSPAYRRLAHGLRPEVRESNALSERSESKGRVERTPDQKGDEGERSSP